MTPKTVKVGKHSRKYYTSNAWEGTKYQETKHLGITDLAKMVRELLKKEFPKSKFSVTVERYSGGQSMTIALMESNVKIVKDVIDISQEAIENMGTGFCRADISERQAMTYHQLNQYTLVQDYDPIVWDNGVFLTKEGHDMMGKAVRIATQYNYDDSDGMIDYFDTNFYLHMAIGRWNKPFIQK